MQQQHFFFVSLTHQAIRKLKDLNLLFVVCLWWKGMRKFLYLFIFGINLKCFPAPFVMKINYLFSGSCVILIVDLNKLKDVEYSYFFVLSSCGNLFVQPVNNLICWTKKKTYLNCKWENCPSNHELTKGVFLHSLVLSFGRISNYIFLVKLFDFINIYRFLIFANDVYFVDE